MTNTLALVNAGIMAADGTVLKKADDIRGGEIVMGDDGTPTGFLKEQAGTYTRSFLDNDNLFSVDTAKETMQEIEQHLLSEGYTVYLDGWGNYFYTDNLYKAAQQFAKSGDMNFVLEFNSSQVKANWIKLFMDGTVESGTGFIDPVYLDGHQGIVNWTEEEVTEIARAANAENLSLHIHAMGNKAVQCAVNAYVNGGKDEMRNTVVHLRNVNEPDYKRMADNNIYVTSGMLWHHNSNEIAEELKTTLPGKMAYEGYPMKSFFDNGVPVSFHTDYPALSNSPDDPFGIMEIALTGVYHAEGGDPWDTDELITREQALTVLTINVARQIFLEDERGNISKGKYADFLLVNKDVLTCPEKELHEAKPAATYFEGKKVFSA